MDSHVMQHAGSPNTRQVRVRRHARLTLVVSQGIPLRRWSTPVSMVAAALWHGIKAVW
jgi:hypothetical protein